MRSLSGAARGLAAVALLLLAGLPLAAQTTSTQNSSQFGMNLPQASLPGGQDEVRTSDGASCRSAVGGNGAYLDAGVLGNPASGDTAAGGAVYGRIVMPIGEQATRLDCNQLYALEIQRLKLELRAAQMGIGGKGDTQEADMDSGWANEGWADSKEQGQEAMKVAPENPAKPKKKKPHVPDITEQEPVDDQSAVEAPVAEEQVSELPVPPADHINTASAEAPALRLEPAADFEVPTDLSAPPADYYSVGDVKDELRDSIY